MNQSQVFPSVAENDRIARVCPASSVKFESELSRCLQRPDHDLTSSLPGEIMQQILENLDARSLDSCALVNRTWSEQCTRSMLARGSRHIRLLFEVIGGNTDDGEVEVFWLFKNDSFDEINSILVALCAHHRLWRLSSFDKSFHQSFSEEMNSLMDGHPRASVVMQLRISGYLDSLNHPERELNNLIIRAPHVLNAMTEGVLTKIATRLVS